jgi:hypothetical protein
MRGEATNAKKGKNIVFAFLDNLLSRHFWRGYIEVPLTWGAGLKNGLLTRLKFFLSPIKKLHFIDKFLFTI